MDRAFRDLHDIHISMMRVICVVLLLLTVASSGSSVEKKSGKISAFSLFNLKRKSKFWSEDVLRQDLHILEASVSPSSGKMNLYNYTSAGNLASYLKLSEVESMYIPVPVNFIFIGFGGEGNHEFRLGSEELERWFTHIDHIFEHTRIPHVGEILMPFYKTSVDPTKKHHFPLVSQINYNFSVHAIQMGAKVTSVLEHTIKVLSRKENISSDTRDDQNAHWQVDIHVIEYFFKSLLDYLELDDAYNVFILNPKRDKDRSFYGYRRGLSESEINYLMKDKHLQAKLLQSESSMTRVFDIDTHKRPLYSKHPMAKFVWTRAEDIHTEEWSNTWLDALARIEKLYREDDFADVIYNIVNQMIHGDCEDMKFLSEALKSDKLSGLHPECLTDIWIGKDRWAFIDLSAGPFAWGPAVGGEGVRTERSLPNVGETVGAIAELSEEEAEDELQNAIQEKFQVFGDGDHQAVDILLAEMDIYELFAFRHCKGRKVKLALCEELDDRMHDLRNELQSFDNEESDEEYRRKAIDALKRMESWKMFSEGHEDFQNYTAARDSFLAHLGATLWSSMRHIITPSIADGAYHFYEKISFQLFFITQEAVTHAKHLPVELKALMNGLSSLIIPAQKVMFSPHMLALSEDPALAMAFSVARRAAAVPLLLVNGTYRSTVRAYLDSSILQQQLQKLNDQRLPKGSHSQSRSTLEVPIFWFIHGDPLLVDKYYQAKSLADMIIVVQSDDSSSWESHLQCNGQSLIWDLRRPVKAALTATLEHLAGLLPSHMVYSHAHESASEDWIWSIGSNPPSITSQGWHISRFQLDTIARSYIITALEESIQLVNEAIHQLSMELTTMKSYKPFKTQERELVSSYNAVVGMWERISHISGNCRYMDAVNLLSSLEDASKRFMNSVNATLAHLHPVYCRKEREVQIELDMTTVPAFLFVIGILYFVLKPKRPKAKIN